MLKLIKTPSFLKQCTVRDLASPTIRQLTKSIRHNYKRALRKVTAVSASQDYNEELPSPHQLKINTLFVSNTENLAKSTNSCPRIRKRQSKTLNGVKFTLRRRQWMHIRPTVVFLRQSILIWILIYRLTDLKRLGTRQGHEIFNLRPTPMRNTRFSSWQAPSVKVFCKSKPGFNLLFFSKEQP